MPNPPVAYCSSTPVNFFGGATLNRLSWLRTSQPFLNAILLSEATKWLIFKDGKVLIASPPSAKASMALLSTKEVRSLLGPEPFFAQGENDGEFAASGVSVLEAARIRGAPVVFLGLQEAEGEDALPSSDFSAKADPAMVIARIKGTPYFTIDVSEIEQTELDRVLQSTTLGREGSKLDFLDARPAMKHFSYDDAAIIAEARSMVDWNARNKVRLFKHP